MGHAALDDLIKRAYANMTDSYSSDERVALLRFVLAAIRLRAELGGLLPPMVPTTTGESA